MKKILALALSAVLMTSVLTGCSGDSGPEITLYDGINSEMQLIHKMVELVVEDKTDVEVTIKDQMSSVLMFRELTREDPSCDIMNSYDGTVLTTFLKRYHFMVSKEADCGSERREEDVPGKNSSGSDIDKGHIRVNSRTISVVTVHAVHVISKD